MKKIKYTYNPQTLAYEAIQIPLKVKVFRVLSLISSVIVTAIILYFAVGQYFTTPKEKSVQRELAQMTFKFNQLDDQVDVLSKVVDNVHERDSRVYQIVFGMEPVDDNVWQGGVGGHERFTDIVDYGQSAEVIKATSSQIDKLERKLVIQSELIEEIEEVASNREDMLSRVPSISPIRVDHLKRDIHLLSGFGPRIDPVFKTPRMHQGIDFTSPRGTPIQATGNGKVIVVRESNARSGYGYKVVIDHGYGYTTLYGHMHRIDVKQGEEVVRGQQIGLVGSTGKSTAPHLHYEVHFKGKAINPIHYCMDGLTPDEYHQLVEYASRTNQSFD
jgi:hypothetical protein